MNPRCFNTHPSFSMSHLVQFVNLSNVGDFFLELYSRGLYLGLKKELQNRCLVFTSSTNREIRKFHVVIVQRGQRNV